MQKQYTKGDTLLCDNGHHYATITGFSIPWGWPLLDLTDGNESPIGKPLPIKCKCGAIVKINY